MFLRHLRSSTKRTVAERCCNLLPQTQRISKTHALAHLHLAPRVCILTRKRRKLQPYPTLPYPTISRPRYLLTLINPLYLLHSSLFLHSLFRAYFSLTDTRCVIDPNRGIRSILIVEHTTNAKRKPSLSVSKGFFAHAYRSTFLPAACFFLTPQVDLFKLFNCRK